jgi:hypothetical protein
MVEDRKIIEEMRQPYRTPAERAEHRKQNAQVGMFNTQPERPDDAPAPLLRLTVWAVEEQHTYDGEATRFTYVKCASRSGAKIFVNNQLGWPGPFNTWVAEDTEIARATEAGVTIHNPEFETVQQFAARVEAENKERRR